jgi:hypothetical protein
MMSLLDEIEADHAALQIQAQALGEKARAVRAILDGSHMYWAIVESEQLFGGIVRIYEAEPAVLSGLAGLRGIAACL